MSGDRRRYYSVAKSESTVQRIIGTCFFLPLFSGSAVHFFPSLHLYIICIIKSFALTIWKCHIRDFPRVQSEVRREKELTKMFGMCGRAPTCPHSVDNPDFRIEEGNKERTMRQILVCPNLTEMRFFFWKVQECRTEVQNNSSHTYKIIFSRCYNFDDFFHLDPRDIALKAL